MNEQISTCLGAADAPNLLKHIKSGKDLTTMTGVEQTLGVSENFSFYFFFFLTIGVEGFRNVM